MIQKKKKKTKKNLGGRPSKRGLINSRQLEFVIKQGFTDKQICELFGITEPTLAKYKKDNSQFFKSIKDWKVIADKNVEKSLYHRAIGYEHVEEKIFNDNGKPLIVPTIKHYPPDTAAAFIWLKNRQPKEWRDKTEIDLNMKEYLLPEFENASAEELQKELDAIRARTPNTRDKT